jgi:hypothetical protein
MTGIDSVALDEIVTQINSDLQEIKEALSSIEKLEDQEHLELLLTRAELGVHNLHQSVVEMIENPQPPEISPDDFDILLQGIRAKGFGDSGKLAIIYDMGKHGRYSCSQASAITAEFSFDEAKVEAAALLYPKLTNPENFFQVLDTIHSSLKQDELRTKLGLR